MRLAWEKKKEKRFTSPWVKVLKLDKWYFWLILAWEKLIPPANRRHILIQGQHFSRDSKPISSFQMPVIHQNFLLYHNSSARVAFKPQGRHVRLWESLAFSHFVPPGRRDGGDDEPWPQVLQHWARTLGKVQRPSHRSVWQKRCVSRSRAQATPAQVVGREMKRDYRRMGRI